MVEGQRRRLIVRSFGRNPPRPRRVQADG